MLIFGINLNNLAFLGLDIDVAAAKLLFFLGAAGMGYVGRAAMLLHDAAVCNETACLVFCTEICFNGCATLRPFSNGGIGAEKNEEESRCS